MRVVGGTLGGRRLEIPAARTTRPTSDRAREAIFNMLVSLLPITDGTVLDLFAGSGALGIEALSRGAAHATFVDSDANACRTITANLATLGIDDRSTVIRIDALKYLDSNEVSVDVAFADPPYRFENWPAVLDAVRARLLVCESDAEVRPHPDQGWDTWRVRRYGTPVITVLGGRDDAPAEP